MNIFKCKTGLKSMSKGGNGILIVSLHKNNFSSNLNHKFAYFLFGSQIKLLAYTENSPSSVTSLRYMIAVCLFTFVFVYVVRFCIESDVVQTCVELYKYLHIFFYPNVKCSVTRVEDLTCSFISLLTNGRNADCSRVNYNS